MNKRINTGVTAALLALSGVVYADGPVHFTEPTDITEKVTTAGRSPAEIRVDADVTIKAGGSLYAEWAGKIYLPYTAGKDVTLSTDSASGDNAVECYYPSGSGNPNGICIGANGGKGRLVHNADKKICVNNFFIGANAEAEESGFVDFAEIKAGTLNVGCFQVSSVAPARIVFSGGNWRPSQKNNGLTDIFKVDAGSRLVLDFEADMDMQMNLGDGPAGFRMSSGEGVVQTTGSGDFILRSSAQFYFRPDSIYFGIPNLMFNAGTNRVQFTHTGDTCILDGAVARVDADDSLPVGPQTGNVKMDTWWAGCCPFLDLNGHVAGVNSLDITANANALGGVTNSNEGAQGVLEFGRFDMDTICQARTVRGNVRFRKVGAGMLTLKNTMVREVEVCDGVCVIEGTVTAETVHMNGGVLRYASGAKLVCDDIRWNKKVIDTDSEISGGETGTYDVCVKSGATLKVSDADRGNKFWRVRFKKSHGGAAHPIVDGDGNVTDKNQQIDVALNKFHLFAFHGGGSAPSGAMRLNQDFAEVAVGTAASALQPGEIVSAKNYLSGTYEFNTGAAVGAKASVVIRSVGVATLTKSVGGAWGENVAWANGTLVSNDELTWETVSMRLNDEPTDVLGFAYSISGYNPPRVNPCHLSVECSQTGEDGSWTVKYENASLLNAHFNHPANYAAMFNTGAFPLTNNWHGAFGTYGTITVEKGATLDLGALPRGNIAFNALSYDWIAGGGTITYFAPAATGTLYLENVPTGTDLSDVTLDFTLTDVGNTGKLSGWKVVVNGVPNDDLVVKLTKDGTLKVGTVKGMLLMVR